MWTEERDCAADCIRACSLPLRRRAVFGPPAVFISPHGPRYGRATDKITRYGLLTDTTWTAYRLLTDVLRTDYGLGHGRHTVSYSRAACGHTTDIKRACDGRLTVKRRSSCFRGTPVERAGVCSSVVRSAFVRRSVASCVAFVLCWFVWRSCAAAHRVKRLIVDVGASTFGHGKDAADSPRASDGLLTGG